MLVRLGKALRKSISLISISWLSKPFSARPRCTTPAHWDPTHEYTVSCEKVNRSNPKEILAFGTYLLDAIHNITGEDLKSRSTLSHESLASEGRTIDVRVWWMLSVCYSRTLQLLSVPSYVYCSGALLSADVLVRFVILNTQVRPRPERL